MIELVKRFGVMPGAKKKYLIDSTDELPQLESTFGNEAYCIADKKTYVCNGSGVYVEKKTSGGGGGGPQPVLVNKSISRNGTYLASSDNADGYNRVVVNVHSSPEPPVPTPTIVDKTITENGVYDPHYEGYDGYGTVTVDVPWNLMGKNPICINPNLYSVDIALEDTNFATWTPSNTRSTIRASENLSPIEINTETYNYLVEWKSDIQYVYLNPSTQRNIMDRAVKAMYILIFKRTSISTTPSTIFNTSYIMLSTGYSSYYTNSGSISKVFGALASGVNIDNPTNEVTFSYSSRYITDATIKTPSLSVVCHDTYFSSDQVANIDQHNSIVKIRGKLWRVDGNNYVGAMWDEALNMWNNPL